MLGCPQQLAPGAQGCLPRAARGLPPQGALRGAGGAADLPSTSTEIDLTLHDVYCKKPNPSQREPVPRVSLGIPSVRLLGLHHRPSWAHGESLRPCPLGLRAGSNSRAPRPARGSDPPRLLRLLRSRRTQPSLGGSAAGRGGGRRPLCLTSTSFFVHALQTA